MPIAWLQQDVIGQWNWQRRCKVATVLQEPLQDADLDRALQHSENLLKHDRTTSVAKSTNAEDQILIKRYNARSQWHILKRALRRSRAQGCWTMSYQFAKAGLQVAQPLMMLEQRFGPFCGNAYFVSEFLRGEEVLKLLPQADSETQQAIADAVKQAFDLMRTHKLSHGDMKASNLLWVNGHLYFVDLDAARQHYTTMGWLAAHRKDKKRFVKNWQDQPQLLELFSDLLA